MSESEMQGVEQQSTATTAVSHLEHDRCVLHGNLGNIVTSYCKDCDCTICVLCIEIEHRGHATVSLVDLTHQLQGHLAETVAHCTATEAQLEQLLRNVDPSMQSLKQYIHRELDVVDDALEEKRAALHEEVAQRASAARQALLHELDLVEQELKTRKIGSRVLEMISRREGMVDGRLGDFICEKMSYDEFLREVDAPLHDPPRMSEMLALQLPTQGLQEVCELITWTAMSVEPTHQVFPS